MASDDVKISVESASCAYGDDYLKWKTWGDSEFGNLSKNETVYFDSEIRRTRSAFPSGAKVLEIGFGNGNFLAFGREKGWDISGTEVNEALVRVAQDRGFSATHAGDLSSFPDDAYDLIVAFDVLEHIPQDELPDMILEIKRVLKKDGFFIARFPNGDSPFGLMNQNGDVTHITAIGSGKVHYFAAKTDMAVIFVGGEAEPLFGLGLVQFIHGIFALPIRRLMNLFVRLVFFPRSSVPFFSSNMVLVYQAANKNRQ